MWWYLTPSASHLKANLIQSILSVINTLPWDFYDSKGWQHLRCTQVWQPWTGPLRAPLCSKGTTETLQAPSSGIESPTTTPTNTGHQAVVSRGLNQHQQTQRLNPAHTGDTIACASPLRLARFPTVLFHMHAEPRTQCPLLFHVQPTSNIRTCCQPPPSRPNPHKHCTPPLPRPIYMHTTAAVAATTTHSIPLPEQNPTS